MKRLAITVIVMIIAILLGACAYTDSPSMASTPQIPDTNKISPQVFPTEVMDKSPAPSSTISDEITTETPSPAPSPTSTTTCDKGESNVSNDYEVNKFNYSKHDDTLQCDIQYPQISGLKDSEKQENINKILKDETLKVLTYYEDPFGAVELSIDYEIRLKDSRVLSIQYSGLGMVSNAAHPDKLFYTTNISIKSGDRLRLRDVVNIDRDFADQFINGEFIAVWDFQGEEIDLTHYTNEKIQEYFMEADSLDNIGTEKQSDVFSYFTADSLGISIPVRFAIGGHAEFEIKYQDIKDNIKPDFYDMLSID